MFLLSEHSSDGEVIRGGAAALQSFVCRGCEAYKQCGSVGYLLWNWNYRFVPCRRKFDCKTLVYRVASSVVLDPVTVN